MTSALLAPVEEKVGHLERNTVGKQPADLQLNRKTTVRKLQAANANTSDGGNGYRRLKRAETANASDALDHFLLPCTKTNFLTEPFN